MDSSSLEMDPLRPQDARYLVASESVQGKTHGTSVTSLSKSLRISEIMGLWLTLLVRMDKAGKLNNPFFNRIFHTHLHSWFIFQPVVGTKKKRQFLQLSQGELPFVQRETIEPLERRKSRKFWGLGKKKRNLVFGLTYKRNKRRLGCKKEKGLDVSKDTFLSAKFHQISLDFVINPEVWPGDGCL